MNQLIRNGKTVKKLTAYANIRVSGEIGSYSYYNNIRVSGEIGSYSYYNILKHLLNNRRD